MMLPLVGLWRDVNLIPACSEWRMVNYLCSQLGPHCSHGNDHPTMNGQGMRTKWGPTLVCKVDNWPTYLSEHKCQHMVRHVTWHVITMTTTTINPQTHQQWQQMSEQEMTWPTNINKTEPPQTSTENLARGNRSDIYKFPILTYW